jgi:hypothetical protein
MVTEFQGKVIQSLNDAVDQRNMDLLDGVIDAANEVAGGDSNVTVDSSPPEGDGDGPPGETLHRVTIVFGGKEASLAGTGGVALLEFAKDAIQTAASNISGVGTHEMQSKKAVERKLESDDDDEEK